MNAVEFSTRLSAAHGGCQRSLGLLLDDCRHYLLAIANARVPIKLSSKIDATDLVQQTYAEAHLAIGRFRGSSAEELRAWLRRILLNNLVDLGREYRQTGMRDINREHSVTESQLELADQLFVVDSNPATELASIEEARRLETALARLPDEHRRVVELRTWDGLRFAEIGERLGRSADAARMLWNRAVERLQADLGDA